MFIIVKYLVTAALIVLISEVAKRSDKGGALIASLPWVTILAMTWFYIEGLGNEKISNHAKYTFWYVLPTMPMFLAIPWLLNKGMPYWGVLVCYCLVTFVLILVMAAILKPFGIDLL